MPQEIEVRYILPAIRREFTKILVEEKKYSQKKASKLLGVTEAAVSQYINSKRAKSVVFGDDVSEEIKKSVNALIENHSKPKLIGELNRIVHLGQVRQILCDIHRAHSKELNDCNICFLESPIQIKTP